MGVGVVDHTYPVECRRFVVLSLNDGMIGCVRLLLFVTRGERRLMLNFQFAVVVV